VRVFVVAAGSAAVVGQWRQLGKSTQFAAAAVWRQQWQRQRGSDSVVEVAVASLAEEVAVWLKCNFCGGGSTLGSVAAAGGGKPASGGDMMQIEANVVDKIQPPRSLWRSSVLTPT
jgi:hypothetical protein